MLLKFPITLTSVAQLLGLHPASERAAGSIPGQGTCPDCGFGPQTGHRREATGQCSSLSPLSKNK